MNETFGSPATDFCPVDVFGRRGPAPTRRSTAAKRLGWIMMALVAPALLAIPARAQTKFADLVGHSIQAGWTDTVRVRLEDGSETSRDRNVEMTLYVGAQNHVFERTISDGLHCRRNRCGARLDPRKDVNVASLGAQGARAWSFEGAALVKMVQLREGARRIVVDFGGGGDALTCSISLHDLHKDGVGSVVARHGTATEEVLSHTISSESCKVTQGNLLSESN
jgi:hypothetical protein